MKRKKKKKKEDEEEEKEKEIKVEKHGEKQEEIAKDEMFKCQSFVHLALLA